MWIIVALVADLCLYLFAGQDIALDFLGGYLIELSLSVDNLFVFLTIFTSFGVPEQYRHRVLHYGIIGAAVLRLVFVLFGVAVVSRFEWILYLFGMVLVMNGVKMVFSQEEKERGENSWGMRLVQRFVPVTETYCGSCFFVLKEKKSVRGKENAAGKKYRHATPLFVVLVVVELSDIIFAIDSVPAVFSVTTNPVIVYTSNLLAVLGLRQMYFGLEKLANRFVYMKYGIATVLIFTGIKLVALMFNRTISTAGSISVILLALSVSVFASLLATKKGSV